MKNEDLFESLQALEETILEDSERRPVRSWRRWAMAAAGVAVVAAGVFAGVNLRENARWNEIMAGYTPDVIVSEMPIPRPDPAEQPEQGAFLFPDKGTPPSAYPETTPYHPGEQTEYAVPIPVPTPTPAPPPVTPLQWNTVDESSLISADMVAGVMRVGEPLTAEQLNMTAPEIRLDWMRIDDGHAEYFLKDGAGGLACVELPIDNPTTGDTITVRLRDAETPYLWESCIVLPESNPTVTGSVDGLDYRAYVYTYFHGEGNPELYPPTEWVSLRVEFQRGNVAYTMTADVPQSDEEQAKAEFAQVLYCYAATESIPDLDSFHCREYLLRDESPTLEEARTDPDFGAYLPPEVPAGLPESDFRRYQFEEVENCLSGYWMGNYDYLAWFIAYADERTEARITEISEIENYDLSLYPIPWGNSVPMEKWEIVDNPVFRAEELTLDVVYARAYKINDAGDTDGWRMRFSVLYPGNVVVRVDAKGISPEWMYEQLSTTGNDGAPAPTLTVNVKA